MPFKAPKTPSIWKNPWHILACGFGVGKVPVMPGTFGTVLGVLIYWPLSCVSLIWYVAATLVAIILGMLACHITAHDWGVADPVAACWDEVAGFLVTMIAVPFSWVAVIVGFILFRIFDIWKPWPVGWVDKHVHGGFGIVLDDVLAGVISCLLLHGLIALVPSWF